MPPIKIAIVGLGARTFKRALGAIINDPEHWQLVAATDPIDSRRAQFQTQMPIVPVFQSVDDMLAWKHADSQDISPRIEAVYVAVPHHSYAQILPKLLSARFHVYFLPAAGRENLHYDPRQDPEHPSDVEMMYANFHQQIHTVRTDGPLTMQSESELHRTRDMIVTRTLQAIYRHANDRRLKHDKNPAGIATTTGDIFIQDKVQGLAMEWPIVDNFVEAAVATQLHEDISIYGNGGVFQRFESEFKNYHRASSSYALLHNSGTNALHALYYAAGFKPGDEVIFPVYTFHATCSPAMHFGITPIFCDANENGTISATAIANVITDKTKAVVITDMWGIPCDMTAICSVLGQKRGILLLEDCSHAHGAMFKGQPVGTFGDGAAWSLQGQKIVTGGEGGITLTMHADFHYRQLIFGHYNKRCKLEIPADHPLHRFALTGAGLKNRAHPLAIAIALNQLRRLPAFHAWKSKYATQLIVKLSPIHFLELPVLDVDNGTELAWYAFTMLFKVAKAPARLTREIFVEQLRSRGLADVDIPRSTGLLHREPLDRRPQELLPYLYRDDYVMPNGNAQFNNAQAFFDEAIKIPVYATEDGQAATDRYVEIILDVALIWMKQGRSTDRDMMSCNPSVDVGLDTPA